MYAEMQNALIDVFLQKHSQQLAPSPSSRRCLRDKVRLEVQRYPEEPGPENYTPEN